MVLTKQEMRKRGCEYCMDHTKRKADADSKKRSHVCIHDECPYHELDAYDSYHQYLKAEASVESLKQVLVKLANPRLTD